MEVETSVLCHERRQIQGQNLKQGGVEVMVAEVFTPVSICILTLLMAETERGKKDLLTNIEVLRE